MYKTIIIIIIIIIGLSNCPAISPQCHTSHTRKWGIKYTSAVRAPSLLRHFRHQEGSRTVASEFRQFFETTQVKLVVLRMCWARPHSSAAEYTLNAARTRLCARRNGTRKVKYIRDYRLLLLIGNVLKTDSKTKPTSKLNCRVMIFIYKLGYVKSAKRDIF